jgi:hypothetical protein
MRFSTLLSISAALSFVTASPHGAAWAKKLAEIKLKARADAPDGVEDSDEMIGDLVSPGPTTPVGQSIANILIGTEDPYSDDRYVLGGLLVPRLGTSLCARDPCCVWKWIADEMKLKFKGHLGQCNKFARYSVRAGFHDAGTWEKNLTYGGADGSLVLANEITRPENNGLQEIVAVYQTWYRFTTVGCEMPS